MSTHPERRRNFAARLRETSGVTLIELIIAITIVGIAVTGTLLSINKSVRSSADPLVVQQGLIVAEAYLEEILLNDYYDPDLGAVGGVCPAKEASRDLYDNVCDYDSLTDVGARDQDNFAIPGPGWLHDRCRRRDREREPRHSQRAHAGHPRGRERD